MTGTYVVEDILGMQRTQRRFTAIVSPDKMKRWCEPPTDVLDCRDEDVYALSTDKEVREDAPNIRMDEL